MSNSNRNENKTTATNLGSSSSSTSSNLNKKEPIFSQITNSAAGLAAANLFDRFEKWYGMV